MFYFLQVFHSSKQQVGLSDLHGVPCTNLGRVLFLKAFFCSAQWLVVFQVSEPLSEADKPCASILSEIRAFEPSETLRRRCSGLARQKDKKLCGATLTKYWKLHTYQFTVPKHTPLLYSRQKVKPAVRQLSCGHHCYVKHAATTKGYVTSYNELPLIWPCQNAVPLVCPFWATVGSFDLLPKHFLPLFPWGCWTLRMSMKRQFLPTCMKMKGVQLIEAIGRLWQLLERQSGEDGLQLGHGNASCQTEPHGTTRNRQAEPVPPEHVELLRMQSNDAGCAG